MPQTGLNVFDRTLQTTNIWLNDIMETAGWDDKQTAYVALRSTLHALRDRLVSDEAVDLGAELPIMVRGIYYEGWRPSETPSAIREKEEFLEKIREEFQGGAEVDAEEVAKCVFRVLADKVSKGEIGDVRNMLPKPIESLWPNGA